MVTSQARGFLSAGCAVIQALPKEENKRLRNEAAALARGCVIGRLQRGKLPKRLSWPQALGFCPGRCVGSPNPSPSH